MFLLGFDGVTFNFPTDPEQARSSVNMYVSWPFIHTFLPDPAILGNHEVIVRDQSTGKSYTPLDSLQLLADADLGHAREIAE